MPSSKSRLWSKKKHTHTHNLCEIKIQQDFIVRKEQKQNKAMIGNVRKIGVEHIKNNWQFYFYWHPLGI
jgi:hypothetical protein